MKVNSITLSSSYTHWKFSFSLIYPHHFVHTQVLYFVFSLPLFAVNFPGHTQDLQLHILFHTYIPSSIFPLFIYSIFLFLVSLLLFVFTDSQFISSFLNSKTSLVEEPWRHPFPQCLVDHYLCSHSLSPPSLRVTDCYVHPHLK